MTGRELIIYILENNLEDEEVFNDGKLLGFISIYEAALKLDVGPEAIKIYFELGIIPGIKIGEEIYIQANIVKGDA